MNPFEAFTAEWDGVQASLKDLAESTTRLENAGVDRHRAALSAVRDAVGALEGRLANLEASLVGLGNHVSTLDSQVRAARSQVDTEGITARIDRTAAACIKHADECELRSNQYVDNALKTFMDNTDIRIAGILREVQSLRGDLATTQKHSQDNRDAFLQLVADTQNWQRRMELARGGG